jgi:predicted DNA-binding protein
VNINQGITMLKPKNLLSKITPQYIIDKAGKKTGVILDILAFEQLIEEIEDIYFASIAHKALQQEDEYITHTDVKKKIARKRPTSSLLSNQHHDES